jgi:hypothetical protein
LPRAARPPYGGAKIRPNSAQFCADLPHAGTGNAICLFALRTMQMITRRRILDAATAVAGVTILIVALLAFDYRTRYVSSADLASVSEDMNYLAVAITLLVAQVVRGELVDYTSLLMFTTTAVVLVVLLMRL